MTRSTTDAVVHDLQFTAAEAIVLTALQQVMIGRDLIAEKSPPQVEVKTRYRNDFAESATAVLWSRAADLPEWAVPPAAAVAAKVPAHQRAEIENAAAEFGSQVTRRSGALLLAIELVASQPRGEEATCAARARRDSLVAIGHYLLPAAVAPVTDLPLETSVGAKADHEEARQFALAFRKFLQWVHSPIVEQVEPVDEVVALVADALGPDRMARSVVRRDLSPFEHVNLQTAVGARQRCQRSP